MSLVPNYDSDSDSSVTDSTPQKRPLNSILPPPKGKAVVYVDLPTGEYDSDEEEKKRDKKRARPTRGVGLADLLPAPKNASRLPSTKLATNTLLTPLSLTRKAKEKQKEAAPVEPKLEDTKTTITTESDIDNEEVIIPQSFKGSFFHIGKELKEEPLPKAPKKKLSTTVATVQPPTETSKPTVTAADTYAYDPNAMYSYGMDPSAYYSYEDQSTETGDVNDELERMIGKRGIGESNIQIKTINQTDILPSDEWRAAQSLTAAPKFEHQTMAASKQQLKKNNIMALAAQAVNNQEKLESMFAANKKSRRDAQNKYGF
ncbi:mitotic checkpoint regulator, MAD2B-interacting-domain-containing protein [Pilobolus umbonatus]|nr:mitotic checkpoint regulator, MAD2B-interacting-domain-containing protein [Pilobolus umbonatus]